MKKILIIVALVLFIWLAPALYLYIFKGYDHYYKGYFHSSKAYEKWKLDVLNAEDHAKHKQKHLGLTDEECEKYHQFLLDSLDKNKPDKVYYPFLEFYPFTEL